MISRLIEENFKNVYQSFVLLEEISVYLHTLLTKSITQNLNVAVATTIVKILVW